MNAVDCCRSPVKDYVMIGGVHVFINLGCFDNRRQSTKQKEPPIIEASFMEPGLLLPPTIKRSMEGVCYV